jgi:pimeloyl-ACP methyl ester carboxylesterase
MAVPWKSEIFTVNGVKTQVMSVGKGEPLFYWHGGGTAGGIDFLAPLAEKFKVYMPYHPGYRGSADDVTITTIHDYALHYLDLLDVLKIGRFSLIGHSMGGAIAACFASEHSDRLKKMVLIGPAGLRVPAHPTLDLFRLKPEEFGPVLAENLAVLGPPPDPHDIDAMVEGYREFTTLARIFWNRMWDPKLEKHLHRINVPTLFIWGKQDKIVPFGQAQVWMKLVKGAKLKSYDQAGHMVYLEKPESVRAIAEFLSS